MPKILIVYDGVNTGIMAKAIADGVFLVEGMDVNIKNISEIMTEDLESANAILLGSPTINKDISSKMKVFIQQIKVLQLQGKVGSAFGSYGWSGEAPGLLTDILLQFNMNLYYPILRVKRQPSEKDLDECRIWGKEVAEMTARNQK